MRILELEIINFGKFNHETVTFHDGMNLIYGENEMGKTTLHSFIRGMFFGIEKQRGRAARKDEYSIREPWFHAGQFAPHAGKAGRSARMPRRLAGRAAHSSRNGRQVPL